MNRFSLSPAARLLVSFTLVLGILVAGRAHLFSPAVTQAQTKSESADVPVSVGIGNSLAVSQGEVVGSLIDARGVSINGVPVDFVIPDRLRILDSVIISDSYMSINGVVIGGAIESSKQGVVIGGSIEETPESEAPAVAGAEVETQDVVISGGEGGLQLVGGELQGDNISVVEGVVRGDNLRLVGTTVSGGGGLSVTGVLVSLPGY